MSWRWKNLDVNEEKIDGNLDRIEEFVIWKRAADNEYSVAFPVVIEPAELKKRLQEYPGLETSFDALEEEKQKEISDEELFTLFKMMMSKEVSVKFGLVKAPHPNIMGKEINGKKYILEFYGRNSGFVMIRPSEYVKEDRDFLAIFYGDKLRHIMGRYIPSILINTPREGFELADYLLLNLFGFKKPLTMRMTERIRNTYNRIRS